MFIQPLLQIAGIGLLVTIVSQILTRAGREDMATLAAIAGLAIVLMLVLSLLSELFGTVQSIFQLY